MFLKGTMFLFFDAFHPFMIIFTYPQGRGPRWAGCQTITGHIQACTLPNMIWE